MKQSTCVSWSWTSMLLLIHVWLGLGLGMGTGTKETAVGKPDTECEGNQYKCRDDENCIRDIFYCDGISDCGDKSDEANCTECTGGSFSCNTIGCAPWNTLCDSTPDCLDGSDETYCTVDNRSGGYPPPTPNWTVYWQNDGVNNQLWLQCSDPDMAIYSSVDQEPPITWPCPLVSSAWKYIKAKYGQFGPDPRVYLILHGERSRDNVIGAQRERYIGFRSLIYMKPASAGNGNGNGTGWEKRTWSNFETILVNLVHLIRHGAKGTSHYADGGICQDKLNAILHYDILTYLESNGLLTTGGLHSSPKMAQRKNPHPCQKWFLQIYENYGKSAVLNQYFTLAKLYWSTGGTENYDLLNLGQLVHFWSGAAGADLSPLARKCFKWTVTNDGELLSARANLPYFIYPTNGGRKSSQVYIPPRNLRKSWTGSNRKNVSLTFVYADENVAFYFENSELPKHISTRAFQKLSSAWKYVKDRYGPYRENSTLHFILRMRSNSNLEVGAEQGTEGACVSSHENSSQDAKFGFRYVIDCPESFHSQLVANVSAKTGAFDVFFQDIGKMALKLCKGVGHWPAYNVSGWTMTSVIVYDIYLGLNMTEEAHHWKESMQNKTHYGKFWFKDWYFPIYSVGGPSALNRFLSLLTRYLPHENEDFTRQLNTGEFLHFWNIAARSNLQNWAEKIFDCNNVEHLISFSNARTNFPDFSYSCDDCDEFLDPKKYSKATKERDIPRIWTETLTHHHNETFLRLHLDDHVALYTTRQNSKELIPLLFPALSHAYMYVKETYGENSFGKNPLLYLIVHTSCSSCTNQTTPTATTCNFRLTKTAKAGNRNVIDCHIIPSNLKSMASASDVIVTIIVTLIKERLHDVLNNAHVSLCGNQMEHILKFDIYRYLISINLTQHTTNKPQQELNLGSESFKGIYWVRDWFLPIYINYGGASVLSRFYSHTSLYWPQTRAQSSLLGRFNSNLSVGEFVHFWSGAAGEDLQNLAMSAFSWSFEDHEGLTKARLDFPQLNYTRRDVLNLPPRTLLDFRNENENGCQQNLTLTYNNQHVALYSKQIRPSNLELFYLLTNSWIYAQETYIANSTLTEFLSVAVQPDDGGTPTNKCSNSIRMPGVINATRNHPHLLLLLTCPVNTAEHLSSKTKIGELPRTFEKYVTQLSMGVMKLAGKSMHKNSTDFYYWPAEQVSGWSMYTILVYDIYLKGLNRTEEAKLWRRDKIDEIESGSPRPKTFSFYNWYLEIYNLYGGSTVIKRFLSDLNLYLATTTRHSTNFNKNGQQLNMGEFVHLWSGAARVNLLELAMRTVGWNHTYDVQFTQARISLPGLNYSCISKNCDENTVTVGRDKMKPNTAEPAKSEIEVKMVIVIGVSGSIIIFIILAFGFKFWSYNKRIRNLSQEIRKLTTTEVEEFIQGDRNLNQSDAHAPIHSQPFNTNFEIEEGRLFIDETLVLGSGEFGLVKKGFIKGDPEIGSADVVVAVKMMKPNVEVLHFKALLSEIKIMAHLGQHDHIASLLGTDTQNIINREVFVAIEFCAKGDLLRYLRDNCKAYQNYFKGIRVSKYSRCVYTNVLNTKVRIESLCRLSSSGSAAGANPKYVNSPITTFDLLEWSRQISNGMAYLGSKQVIHGDLAARNVLLTENNIAKISDFGLSRQLINYSNYLKKTQSPLPWRWLAIEALNTMTFSIQSDVWSFGVTLWEIFTLGKVPYSARTWDSSFVADLIAGERLNAPDFGNKEIHNLMLNCMKSVPTERLDFQQITTEFENMTESLITSERDRHYLQLE